MLIVKVLKSQEHFAIIYSNRLLSRGYTFVLMDIEQLLQIRRRIIYLTFKKEADLNNYEALKKEQRNLQALLIDRSDLLRIDGIKASPFGDLIMKGADLSHKQSYFKITRNEIINAIDNLIYG